jgi:secreted PhoX family phosphatase
VPAATRFNGGEGAWYQDDVVHFTTKGDNRVWKYDSAADTIEILYQANLSPTPQLTGVDNVFVTPAGEVLVAEDGGNMEIVALTPSGAVKPVIRLPGVSGSEITGPALSPDGQRLYFNSQRNPGRTYEVRGPWTAFSAGAPVPAFGSLAGAVTAAALVGASALLARREDLGGASAR